MQGVVIQVSVSAGGIPKRAIPEARLTRLGLEGDACTHSSIHGGPLQAVLLISAETVDELIALGYPLFYGALGENLTTQGLDRTLMRPGQRYRVGDAVIELTTLRQPCRTLNVYGRGLQQELFDQQVKAGDPSSPRWGMGGFYASVVQPGRVSPGAPILLLEQAV